MLQLVSTKKRHNQLVNHFPYTLNGRWFPQEWFDEMGLLVPILSSIRDGVNTTRTYNDISEVEIQIEIAAYNQRQLEIESAAQRERLRLEMEAEAERLRILALRPPLVDRIFTAFQDTLFTAVSVPVYRNIQPVVIPDPLPLDLRYDDTDWPVAAPVTPQHAVEYVQTPGYQQILNERTDQVLSIMTTDYEIINDEDVIRRTAELFDAAEINAEPAFHHVTVGKDGVSGRSTFMEFNLPEMSILPGTEWAQEMKIAVSNSFDGTKKERLLMLLRNQSNNYQLAFSQHENFAIKHRTGANARLVQQFGTFVHASVEHNTACIRALRDTSAPNIDCVATYLNDNRVLSGERNAEKLMGRWMVQETTTNLWHIYQIFTRIITEDYGRNFSAKIGKMEQLNADVRRAWPELLGCPILPVI